MNIIFYETKFNKYSINALLACLEHSKLTEKLDIKVISELNQNLLSFEKSKDLVFCFSFCTPQLKETLKLLEKIKSLYPNSVFIAGGPHPSGAPEETLKAGFDYVFVGEAEECFPRFLNSMGHERIIKGTKVNLDKYQSFSEKFNRFSPIEITRGCPFACKFCQTSYIFGTKPRHRSIDSIIKHVEVLISYGIKDLRFITPNALSYGSEDGKTVNLQQVEKLLRSIKALSKDINIFFGTFPSEVRPEHLTKEALSVIKPYISNKAFSIGAQSGSDSILETIGRKHTTQDVYTAVTNALEAGFSVNVDFILGLPDEEEKHQEETLNFIEKLIKLSYNKGIPIKIRTHYFLPLAGTPFYKAKPSPISKKLTKYLGKLYNLKLVFGQWHLQKIYTESILANKT
ncbi:MAG: TIGR04013 family B12-binding domain/radical SAM domain-containing protein [Thermodesulfovibrionaceae bacterium]